MQGFSFLSEQCMMMIPTGCLTFGTQGVSYCEIIFCKQTWDMPDTLDYFCDVLV